MGLTAGILTAGLLLFALMQRGGNGNWLLISIIASIGVLVIALALAFALKKPSAAITAENPEKKKSAAIWAIIAALIAQGPAIGKAFERYDGDGGDSPIAWIGIIVFALLVITAIVVLARRRSQSPGFSTTPWVVPLLLGLLIAGVAASVLMVFASSDGSVDMTASFVPYIVLAIMILVLIFVVKIFTVASRSSAYALPDVLPVAGPPTDPHFVHGGYWDGTRMLNQRVWGIPVPVTGRGYFIQGQGKAWLASEVLAFHLYLTRNPLVIPYGIIHSINTKKLILRKNHFPGPGLSIIWGRPDMPMVTTIQVTQNKAENELWAQEIMRRAGVWKEKMAAMEAAQAASSQ